MCENCDWKVCSTIVEFGCAFVELGDGDLMRAVKRLSRRVALINQGFGVITKIQRNIQTDIHIMNDEIEI